MVHRRAFIAGGLAAGTVLATGARAASRADIPGLLTRHKVAAVSFAAIEDGAVAMSGATGLRWADGPPVEAASQFQAASLSKTVNALIVLSLARDGLIGLDDPVNDRLKSWTLTGPSADRVTIRHLLSHTGATSVHGFAGYPSGSALPTLKQILDGEGNSPAVVNEGRPGRAVVYSGGGTTVLQQMVEDVADASYSDVADARVLKPLGMANSFMRPARDAQLNTITGGHGQDGAFIGYNDYPEIAAAGLWTTPADLCRALLAIAAAHNGDADSFIPQTLAREMLKPVVADAALGTFIGSGGRFVHTGVNYGFRCLYLCNPRNRSGYVVMSNGENGEALNDAIVGVIRAEMGW